MRRTFRAKLLAVVAVDALALLALLLLGAAMDRRSDRELTEIRERFVPRLGLAPRLQAAFESVSRTFQDAAAAADLELLMDAERQGAALRDQLAASPAINPTDAAILRVALDDYLRTTADVTRRIATDEGGADAAAIGAMQAQQRHIAELITRATSVDERDMVRAFESAAAAQAAGARVRLIIAAACLVIVVLLTAWIGRSQMRALAELTAGFRRFGDGDFTSPIQVRTRDELADAARQANQMAERLRRLAEERDQSDWFKSGHTGLADALRGELTPEQVADRAVATLARHLGAPAGAVYYGGPGEDLILLGRYGVELEAGAPRAFAPGEGLIGQAARWPDITVVTAREDDALQVRTALAVIRPRALVFVPLLRGGVVVGVLELIASEAWEARGSELLLAVRDTLAITIEVARARSASAQMLVESRRQAAELLDARAGLVEKAEELARISNYKSQFLANMSHELRTPMNAVIGFAELLVDRPDAFDLAQQQEFLGHILNSSRHLLHLINDVLDLSKIEAGRFEFHPEALSVRAIVDEVRSILQTSADEKGITVVASVEPEADEAFLDPSRLKQVLYNYLSNALKFTPAGGRVELRASVAGGDRLRFEVSDTGVGISDEDLARLFTEFQQVGSVHRRASGTGLGLALTRRLVEAQGGTVGVRSKVGAGSVFHAVLPRRVDSVAAQPLRVGHTPAGAPRVLVVEDDREEQRALAEALVGAGYAVEVASTGSQALGALAERSFDAVTLDLLLPDMNGLDVLRSIRTGVRNPGVPVVVITMVAERGVVTGFAVQDVLAKPLDVDLLLAALVRADVPPGPAQTVVIVDDDPAALELMAASLEHLGYDTRCERDAAVALQSCRREPPAAIVLDLLMPGMTGFEFLDQLRSGDGGRGVPVIVWTGKDLEAREFQRLRASADAVVSKGHGGCAAVISELAQHLARSPAA